MSSLDRSVITPQNSETKVRGRSALSFTGKENTGNSRPNSGSAGSKLSARVAVRGNSRLTKPLTAQTIYEQKSAENVVAITDGNKSLCDEMDAEVEEPLTSCPIALALRGTDRDYSRIEDVLETKLTAKPAATLREMKDRIEEQKQVVKELRGVGKTLHSRCIEAENVATAFTAQHEAAAAKIQAQHDEVVAERDAGQLKVTQLTQEKDDIDKRLNSALASFAAVDEQRRVTLEERDSARAQVALKTAAEESTRKELQQASLELAASKSELALVRASVETRQMAVDREMNEMRESLGREMVAAREASSK